MSDALITTFRIRFANQICQEELPFLRGAVIREFGNDTMLSHNHIGNTLRYAYPLIQYKRIDGCATIMGIGDGVEHVECLSAIFPEIMRIGRRKEQFLITSVIKEQTLLQLSSDMHSYSIRKYLPLNQTNYEQYRLLEGVIERYALLEHCLVGIILSFAKGLGVFFEGQVRVVLTRVSNERLYQFKNIKMMGFDVVFKTNVMLPQFIGLGKKVSFGYGTVTTINEFKNE